MSNNNPLRLPWVHNDCDLILGQCSADDDEAPFIADVIETFGRAADGLAIDRERFIAEYICTACNAHETLVSTLDGLLTDFEVYVLDEPDDDIRERNRAWIAQARNALSSVKVGAP